MLGRFIWPEQRAAPGFLRRNGAGRCRIRSRHSFSFVVVGCNRINAADVTPDNPSTANREQLNRTFREVAALRPLPRFMFFAGDLVLGYTDDPNLVERELSAWRDI